MSNNARFHHYKDFSLDGTSSHLQIIITVTGSPKMLEAQLSSIQRFFPLSVKVLVVDDSRHRRHKSNYHKLFISKRLRAAAEAHGAQYVRMPQYLHFMRKSLYVNPNPSPKPFSYPSLRHADSLQFGISHLGPNVHQLMLLDSDMIPIAEFVPEHYFAEAAVWFQRQSLPGPNGDIVYPTPGLFFADLLKADVTNFMNWDCAVIDGVNTDTGGEMRPWLEANAHQSKPITSLTRGKWKWERDAPDIPSHFEQFLKFDARHNNGMQFCELILGKFLHFAAGSNYYSAKHDSNQERMSLFIDGIKSLVEE
jgi:hypothetical protein